MTKLSVHHYNRDPALPEGKVKYETMAIEMRALIAGALLAFSCQPVQASAQAIPVPERANQLRQSLQEILSSAQPSRAAYERYFELFPGSMKELQTLFINDEARALLLQGIPATDDYYVHACRAYDFVGARRYVEKFLRMAVETGNWGGVANQDDSQLTSAGHLSLVLLFRGDCATAETPGLFNTMIEVAASLDDGQLDRAYVSMGWDTEGAGLDWSGRQWLLDGICRLEPARCATTKALTEKYRSLATDGHEH